MGLDSAKCSDGNVAFVNETRSWWPFRGSEVPGCVDAVGRRGKATKQVSCVCRVGRGGDICAPKSVHK